MRRGSEGLVAVLAAVALCATPALADQRECEASQLKEIARYSQRQYDCMSKAVKKNQGAGECLAKASNRLTEKLQKIADKAGCQIVTDFDALDLGLQSTLDRDADAVALGLGQSSASIEPCTVGYHDVWNVELIKDDLLEVRVDTVDDSYFFDPSLTLTGVSNVVCVSGTRNVERLLPFEFACTFDPQSTEQLVCESGPRAGLTCVGPTPASTMCETSAGAGDGVCIETKPGALVCPGLTITSGPPVQTCAVTVTVQGSCQDPSRADYRLEIYVNGRPGVAERVQSNVP